MTHLFRKHIRRCLRDIAADTGMSVLEVALRAASRAPATRGGEIIRSVAIELMVDDSEERAAAAEAGRRALQEETP